MKKVLIVVDMQNDFIDGALGTKEAQAIVPNVVDKIKNWEGDIIITQDTHKENYLETREGKYLPVEHCIRGTKGWELNAEVKEALDAKNAYKSYVEKNSFGEIVVAEKCFMQNYDYIEFIGLCSEICVINNLLLVKALCPEVDVAVDASCCAGATPDGHEAALLVAKSCQVKIL